MLISSRCLRMLIGGFRPLLWSQTASPGERRGAFGNRVLCAEPRAGGCALTGPAVYWLPFWGCRCERLRHQAEGSEVRGAAQGGVWLLHHCSPVAALCKTRPSPLSGTQCQDSCQIDEANQASQSLEVTLPLPCTPGPLAGCLRGSCCPGAGTSVPLDSQESGPGGAPVTCRELAMQDAGAAPGGVRAGTPIGECCARRPCAHKSTEHVCWDPRAHESPPSTRAVCRAGLPLGFQPLTGGGCFHSFLPEVKGQGDRGG